MCFLLLRTFFFSSKALHPTVFNQCSDHHFSLCPVVGGNLLREFRPFFPRIKIPSWFIFMCFLFFYYFVFFSLLNPHALFIVAYIFFFSSPKAFHPTVFDRCSDRHFSLCPVIGGNSPREFCPFFPRIKIPSWMHSELHFPTVNIQRPILPQKMQNRQHNCHVTDIQRN